MSPSLLHIFLAVVVTAFFCWIAFRLKFLSSSGFWAATLIGVIILGWGGWRWALPLLAFFISSSLLSRARARTAAAWEEVRGSRREAVQVFANGGVAAVIVVAQALGQQPFYLLYLAALASANADTWSTEMGLLWGQKPRSIATGKPVLPGTSGGVTAAGLLSAFLGSLLIAWTGQLAVPQLYSIAYLPLVTAAGFFGSLADSLLGATVQERRICGVCGKIGEQFRHCDQSTAHHSGWRGLNNDGVNLLCTASGVLLAAILIKGL